MAACIGTMFCCESNGLRMGCSLCCCPSFLLLLKPLLAMLMSSASPISVSWVTELLVLLWPLVFFGGMARVGTDAGAIGVGLGGPGAMAIGFFVVGFSAVELVGVVTALPVPAEPAMDFGESASLAEDLEGVFADCAIEFLRLAIFFDREEVVTAGFPLPRLRFLMTSVFKLRGRTTPWSLRNRPQALQRGCPSGLRRQSGVVVVKQFVQVVGTPLSPPGRGLPGLDGAAELKFDSGGELGEDCGRIENIPVAIPAVFGVEVVRGILRVRCSPPRLRTSLTDAEDPCPLPSPPCSQPCGEGIISA
jgi:hypothetical protein